MTINLKELFGDISELDKKVIQTLLEAIAENHSQDFDYIKFKKSVINLMDMDIAEETSIKSAYATASTMGLDKKHLINSAKKYMSVLVKEKEKFADTLKRQIKTKVDSKLQEKKDLQKGIESHQKKIEQLQKEIDIYQQRLEGIEDKAAQAKAKIEKTRDNFVAVYDHIHGTISDDIDKWSSHLS